MSGGSSNVLYLCSANGLLAGGHRGYACGAHRNFWVFTIPLGAAGKPRGLFPTFPGCCLRSLAPLPCRVLLCVWAFEVGAEHVFSLLWDSPMKGFTCCLLSSGDWPPCHHHDTSFFAALLFPSAERFLSIWSEE